MRTRSVLTYTRNKRGFVGFVVGAVSAACLVGGGVAIAAIPSSATGSITGCVRKTTGATRIIDYQAGRRCTAKETTLNWAQTGPQGIPGPQGAPSGLAGFETDHREFVIAAGDNFTRDIRCPSDPNLGKSVINGGYYIDPGGVINQSQSIQLDYVVSGSNPTDHAVNLSLNVFCATVDF